MGDGWSVAWRLHDAQFWGVPQRRKRISLVADFGGQSAPEILFERKSVSGNFEKSREQRENASGYLEESADKAISFQERAGKPGGGKGILIQNERTGALSTLNNQSVVYSLGHDIRSAKFTDDEITDPLTATDYKDPIKINAPVKETYQNVTGCLDCSIAKGTGNQLANQDMFIANTSVVRRLTPLECERLQGYPDGWTDIGEWIDSKGKRHKDADSPRYKALGNSIALPFWEWMAHRMTAVLKNDGINNPTMASLFDGIGGFPLVYSRCGVKPIWASEIEEFPIAVTKIRFPE